MVRGKTEIGVLPRILDYLLNKLNSFHQIVTNQIYMETLDRDAQVTRYRALAWFPLAELEIKENGQFF